MSRWLDQFKNHAFWAEWNALKEELGLSEIEDESVLTSVQELARLNKVVVYLDRLMAVVDPELVPQQTWTNFQQQASPCKQEIINYNSNKNIAHLSNANNHVDNLLSYVRPWVVSDPKEVNVSMSKSLEAYDAVISKYSESYRSDAKALVEHLEEAKVDADELLDKVRVVNESVEGYQRELFEGDESQDAIKERIDSLVTNFENEYEKVNSYYSELIEGDEDESSIKIKVKEASEKVYEYLNQVVEHLKAIKEDRQDLEEFHIRIFGASATEGQPRKEGLKGELEAGLGELKNYDEEQKTKHSALTEEIESLLPGATNV